MEKIIGRDYEFGLLNYYLCSGKSEFVALYGRRRVGKTFLIRKFFADRFDFYATGIIGGSRKEELNAFNIALSNYGYTGAPANTWMDAFNKLALLIETKRRKKKNVIVFIDELPCFDTQHAGFVHALDFFWNYKASRWDNIMLIVCGSATSWMIRNIVNNHGGLHNRITHNIHLHPFSLLQVALYAHNKKSAWTPIDIVQMYMALGGIPYYWSKVDFMESVAQNLDKLFFYENAELKEEYERLFYSLYKNPEYYMKIVKLLCENKKGMMRNEIAQKVGLPSSGSLSRILQDLEYCDFIKSYNNVGKLTGQIYQIMDFYTIFYNAFCAKKSTDKHFWSNHVGTPKINTFLGLAYERICMIHIDQILIALHLDNIHTEYYSWRSRASDPGAQIDLIIDRADGIQTICEIKFSMAEYAISKIEYQKLLNRVSAFRQETRTRKGFQIVFVTTYGLKDNTYSEISSRNVKLSDLFA